MEDTDDVDIIPAGKRTYKDIVMEQFATVIRSANVEFRGGFWTKIPIKGGEEKLIYIPDTRETFCNGVRILAIIWKQRFDTKMKDKYKEYKKRMKTLQTEFMDKSTVEETVILGENFYTEEADKIALEEYKNKKLELHIGLFAQLNRDMSKNNYMEISGGTYE